MVSKEAIPKGNTKRIVGLVLGLLSLVVSLLIPGSEALSAEGVKAIGILVLVLKHSFIFLTKSFSFIANINSSISIGYIVLISTLPTGKE